MSDKREMRNDKTMLDLLLSVVIISFLTGGFLSNFNIAAFYTYCRAPSNFSDSDLKS
jgi:hypothetical protein